MEKVLKSKSVKKVSQQIKMMAKKTSFPD